MLGFACAWLRSRRQEAALLTRPARRGLLEGSGRRASSTINPAPPARVEQRADCPGRLPIEEKRIPSLFAWRSEAREGFEVKDWRSQPPEAATALAVVLEFEFLSRIIAAMQSMMRQA